VYNILAMRLQTLQATATSGEYHVLLSGGQAFSERLTPAPAPAPRANPTPGTVLITGGTKGLGLEFAKDRLRRGARAAVLLSRNAALPKEVLVELAGAGQAVFTVSCDTCDLTALEGVIGWAREWLPPVQVSNSLNLWRCHLSFSTVILTAFAISLCDFCAVSVPLGFRV
jgi:hypothetical protein